MTIDMIATSLFWGIIFALCVAIIVAREYDDWRRR